MMQLQHLYMVPLRQRCAEGYCVVSSVAVLTDPHIKLEAKGGYLEVPQTGQEATSAYKQVTKYMEIISEAGYECVCLKARSIANKKDELNVML